MNPIQESFDELNTKLQSAAFLVSSGAPAQKAQNEILQAMILADRIRQMTTGNVEEGNTDRNEVQEINKVKRRLNLWSKKPDQINSKILSSFLSLERDGARVITEKMLKDSLVPNTFFDSNFVQMRTIADRNHGKVFDLKGDIVSLWPPVESYVRDFERATTGN